ncbi:hypothetical protein ACS0TY_008157 [Phlomoides rotata]
MAKRELSSTLKNLKFMQRAAQKDEKAKKEEEAIPSGDFPASAPIKKCVVIVEGDPHPSAARGRISFLNFNPSIDKLNQDASGPSETESAATSSGRQSEAMSMRLDKLELGASSDDVNSDVKRKRADAATGPEHPNKSRKSDEDNQDSSPARSSGSKKQDKREKLDWSVLRPPKHHSKRR